MRKKEETYFYGFYILGEIVIDYIGDGSVQGGMKKIGPYVDGLAIINHEGEDMHRFMTDEFIDMCEEKLLEVAKCS